MPSSLIIVGLAAAWLAVLVPMVARKRQVVTRTNDAALAARVVRRGSTRGGGPARSVGGEGQRVDAGEVGDADDDLPDDEIDARDVRGGVEYADDVRDYDTHGDDWNTLGDDRSGRGGREAPGRDDAAWERTVFVERPSGVGRSARRHAERAVRDDAEPEDAPWDEDEVAGEAGDAPEGGAVSGSTGGRRYRPGRGGFDPEAAALAAKAKYAFRQRVVIALLLAAVASGVTAGVVSPVLWPAHGVIDLTLVGYLVYLRRQVRIEQEIRERRLARLRAADRRAPKRPDPLAEIEVLKTDRRGVVGSERKPMPTSRVRRQAVVVDLEDEDPAFHELDEPGYTYPRASGE
ncbi:divisome protein SepX/GlpR [Saccharomonospora saliphila]|uniref:divisome protein SepX/GlpR n=1 Tax=Saccharomonospora saliphila TaxID=369829 RepID=UPI0003A1C343|nr:gephyrin-like molybdotransferase receptor GlpR [Saccharomonospora saliphila]